MLFRCLFALALTLSVSTLAAITPGPNHIDNPSGREWVVRYDANENVSHFPRSKRVPDTGAVRLRITKTTGKAGDRYNAQLWRFKVSKMGGAHYELTGKAQVNLSIQGNHSGRNRMAFWSSPAALINPDTGDVTHTVTINGIWQPGHSGARSEDRIQLRMYLVSAGAEVPAPAPAKAGKADAPKDNCEEDPDTDVLEETGSPQHEDDPPPYDGDP